MVYGFGNRRKTSDTKKTLDFQRLILQILQRLPFKDKAREMHNDLLT